MTSETMSRKQFWALVGISLSSLIGFIDIAIVNTAIASIQKSLSASFLEIQWVMNSYLLFYCVFLTIMGKLGDHFGHRLILYFAIFLYALSSLAAGLATHASWLIGARAFQGIAMAMLIPSALGLITHLFPVNMRGKTMGIWSGITGLGLAFGPVLGGFLVELLSWRWIFFINVPLALISLLICLKTVDETPLEKGKKSIDWIGFLLIAVSLASLVVALLEGPLWLLLIALPLLVAFYFFEGILKDPLIDFAFFRNRIYLACAIGYFTLISAVFVVLFFLPLFLHVVLEKSTLQVGFMILPITAMVVLISPLQGALLRSLTPKWTIILGFAVLSLSLFLMLFFTKEVGVGFLILTFILFGLGWALTFSPMKSEAVSAVPQKNAGIASALLLTVDSLGGTLSLAISGLIFRRFENGNFVAGFRGAMIFLFALAVITGIGIYLLLNKKGQK